MRLFGKSLVVVFLVCIPEPLLLPSLRHMTEYPCAGPWTSDFVNIIQAVSVVQILPSPQVAGMTVQMSLA